MSYIKISNLKKNYGRKKVLTDINLDINKGECIGIVGANGCGKSTLLKILAGAIKPTSGSFSFEGLKVGYIPQDNPLFDNLTGYDNLRLWYCDSPTPLEEEISAGVIQRFGIDKFLKSTVRTLSGGMKKRLSIACGVAIKPDILILDEVLSVGDAKFRKKCEKKIMDMFDKGITVLFVSHNELQVKNLCTKGILLERGKLTASGTVDEVIEKYRKLTE